MYTVDKFLRESSRTTTNHDATEAIIEEVMEIQQEVQAERLAKFHNYNAFKTISRDELITKLKISEEWSRSNGDGFVGLVHFVKNHLGNADFDYASSFELINTLHDEGVIEICDHQGEGHIRPVKAIRMIGSEPTPLPTLTLGQFLRRHLQGGG
jgi:hypothetical protein